MKKFIVFLILCFTFLPMVKADMGGPELQEYEVIVTKESGADRYDYKEGGYGIVGKIPKDTILTITSEFYDDDAKCYQLYFDSDEYAGYVLSTDVVTKEDVIEPKRVNYLDKTAYLFIVKEDQVLYSGPAFTYKKVTDTIKKGTELGYDYVDDYGGWGYADYNGIKGWIYLDSTSVGWTCGFYDSYWETCDNKNILSIYGTKMYDFPSSTANYLGQTIPKNTNLKYNYYYYEYLDDYQNVNWARVTYNGVTGWVDQDNFASQIVGSEFIVAKKVTLFNSIEPEEKSNITLNVNTRLEPIYYYYILQDGEYKSYYYIKYEGKFYWVDESYLAARYYDDEMAYVILDEIAYLYREPSLSSEKIDGIKTKKNETLYYMYSFSEKIDSEETPYRWWFYVIYDGEYGWVTSDDAQLKIEMNKDYQEVLVSVENVEKSKSKDDLINAYKKVNSLQDGVEKVELLNRLSNIVIEEPVIEEPKEEEKSTKLNPKEFAYLCIGGAGVLALTAVVTIVLVNKNKSKKANKSQIVEDSSKKETPKEEPTTEEPPKEELQVAEQSQAEDQSKEN